MVDVPIQPCLFTPECNHWSQLISRKSVSWVFDAKQDFLIPLPEEEVINTLVKTGVESLYCQPKEGTKANGPLQNDHQAWPTPNGSHLMIPVILSNGLITLKMPTGSQQKEISRRDEFDEFHHQGAHHSNQGFSKSSVHIHNGVLLANPPGSPRFRHDFLQRNTPKGWFWQNVRWFQKPCLCLTTFYVSIFQSSNWSHPKSSKIKIEMIGKMMETKRSLTIFGKKITIQMNHPNGKNSFAFNLDHRNLGIPRIPNLKAAHWYLRGSGIPVQVGSCSCNRLVIEKVIKHHELMVII